MQFTRSDLLFKDYFWNERLFDDPRISGLIDETKFSRIEGNEVLYLINILMKEWGLEGKEAGQKLERMIRFHLPYNALTQLDVKAWIKHNWKFY